MERFTTRRIEQLTCPPGENRAYFMDTVAKGLQLCVTAKQTKTFILYRRVNGRPTRVRLGSWPHELSLEEARKKAAIANGQIAQGVDPRKAKRTRNSEMTFGELFTRHIDNAKRFNKTWEENQKQFNRYLIGWKGRRLSEVTRQDVQALHARLGEKHGPYAANRTLSLVAHMFRVTANDVGWKGENPAVGIQKFREKSRERFLQADELPRFFAAMQELSEQHRDFFAIALFTGARRGNVQAMRWDDIHLDRAEWRIPETKNGQPLTVALSQTVVEILIRRAAIRKGPFVFPGYGKTGHIMEPKSAWARLLKKAGISDLRLHDLRRTLGSWQAGLGISSTIIGKSLGHKSTTATAIYSRLALDPVRSAVNAAGNAIIAAAKQS
ncbi:MAG: site-specific integrase [Gemmataceae bacterium]